MALKSAQARRRRATCWHRETCHRRSPPAYEPVTAEAWNLPFGGPERADSALAGLEPECSATVSIRGLQG